MGNKLKFVLIIIIITSALFAHEDHKKKSEVPHYDTLTIVNNDTIAVNGIPVNALLLDKIERGTKSTYITKKTDGSEVKVVTLAAAFEHIHNKVIHFPIALSVIGFLLMMFGYKENKYWNVLRIFIPFAAIVGIIAVLSGLAQAEPFEGTSTYDLVKTHELLGFGVLASLILWSVTLHVKKLNKLVWLFSGLTVILVSIAGLYGGVLAH